MHYPWTFVVSLKADSDIISGHAYANDITSNRIHEVISRIPCTSDNSKIVLKNGQFMKYCGTLKLVYSVKMDRMLERDGSSSADT
jgi:hypothetical protein